MALRKPLSTWILAYGACRAGMRRFFTITGGRGSTQRMTNHRSRLLVSLALSAALLAGTTGSAFAAWHAGSLGQSVDGAPSGAGSNPSAMGEPDSGDHTAPLPPNISVHSVTTVNGPGGTLSKINTVKTWIAEWIWAYWTLRAAR